MASAIMPKQLSRGNNSRILGAGLAILVIDTRKSGGNTLVREVVCSGRHTSFLTGPPGFQRAALRIGRGGHVSALTSLRRYTPATLSAASTRASRNGIRRRRTPVAS
jgi:hypothetical protein